MHRREKGGRDNQVSGAGGADGGTGERHRELPAVPPPGQLESQRHGGRLRGGRLGGARRGRCLRGPRRRGRGCLPGRRGRGFPGHVRRGEGGRGRLLARRGGQRTLTAETDAVTRPEARAAPRALPDIIHVPHPGTWSRVSAVSPRNMTPQGVICSTAAQEMLSFQRMTCRADGAPRVRTGNFFTFRARRRFVASRAPRGPGAVPAPAFPCRDGGP